MVNSSYHNEFSIGDHLWWSHHIMNTSTWQWLTDDIVIVNISYRVCQRLGWVFLCSTWFPKKTQSLLLELDLLGQPKKEWVRADSTPECSESLVSRKSRNFKLESRLYILNSNRYCPNFCVLYIRDLSQNNQISNFYSYFSMTS